MTVSTSERIVAELRGRIESGALSPGDLLPSARQIAREWRVAIATASRVHAGLRAAGLAETLPGIGVVVRRPKPAPIPSRGVWSRAVTPQAEQIVATAVAIADTEGLDAVSMRRLAVELGIAPMSLYGHVTDKEGLLERMLDVTMAEWRAPDRGDAGWRDCLEAAARGLWEQFRRHPWLAPALSLSRPAIVAGGIGWTEFVLEALAEPVPDLTTRFDLHLTLFAYVRGLAIDLEAESAASAVTGLDADAWMDTQLPALRAIADATRYPQLGELVRQPYDFSLDRIFERGLRCLLDGLSIQIDGQRAMLSVAALLDAVRATPATSPAASVGVRHTAAQNAAICRTLLAGGENLDACWRIGILQTLDDYTSVLRRGGPQLAVGVFSDEPPTTGRAEIDAAFAALAEYLAERDGWLTPAWALDQSRQTDGWYPSIPAIFRADADRESPEAFRRRGILITSRSLARA